jgi:multiple sugar transport system permease protein
MSRFESISTMKQKSWLYSILGLTVLGIGTTLVLLPLLIVIMTSLLPTGSATGAFWPKQGWSGDNYRQAWLGGRFLLAFANSTFVALSVTGLQVITSALAGYALARLQFWGRQTVLLIALATLVIPFQLLVIPVFLVLKSAHLLNTYGALILPTAANGFGIVLMRQFFMTIPVEIEEAALLDGATRWQMLWQVLLPLTRPAVVTLFLFTFIGEWNDLFKPLVFTTKPELITVQLTLANFQEQFTNNWPLMMAAVVISSLPIVLLCILGQRQLVRGIATTGVKG